MKTPRMRREAAFGVFCLTTVYPTSTHGVHGNSGGKSAGKDVFPSGKGWKGLKMSGNRYSGFLWDSVKKRQIWEKQKKHEKALFYAVFQHFETHSNLSLVRCLTTVIPLYFHFKNWLNFVQQQN